MEKVYDFIALDFETATRNPNSACSIGMAMVKDNEIVDTYYSLIQPPRNLYSNTNIAVHGIKPSDTLTSPTFDQILPHVKSLIRQSHAVIAHNARFDTKVLLNSATNALQGFDFRYLDSIEITNPLSQGISGKLTERAKYFGVKNQSHHDALNDAKVCAEIVIACLEKTELSFLEYILEFNKIRIYNFSALTIPNIFKNPNYEKVDISSLNNFARVISGPFKNKEFVFTGEFESGKEYLMKQVIKRGGVIKNSTTKSCNYCVVGVQDPRIVPSGISGKHRKAIDLQKSGSTIEILSEQQLLTLLNTDSDSF